MQWPIVNLNKFKSHIRWWFVILSAAPLVACASGISHFDRRVSVSNTFENYELLPGYQYYYNGQSYGPDAVVAVRPGYKLVSPYWHAANPTQRQLRKWIEDMLNTPGSEFNQVPNGALILNDNGERIGVWYSVWDVPLLKFVSAKEFYISDLMMIWPPWHSNPDD